MTYSAELLRAMVEIDLALLRAETPRALYPTAEAIADAVLRDRLNHRETLEMMT